jgi:hypothetical protein
MHDNVRLRWPLSKKCINNRRAADSYKPPLKIVELINSLEQQCIGFNYVVDDLRVGQ